MTFRGRFARASLCALSFLVAASCRPEARHAGDGGSTGGEGGSTGGAGGETGNGAPARVSGHVWAPGQAPGQVPPGHEIPIFGAAVYLSATRPEPIPQHVYCEQCVEIPQDGQTSGYDGSFSLGATAGDYWLVIQKGQFRLEQQVSIQAGDNALPDAATTLPSQLDPAAGRWIPRVAIAAGTNDKLQAIFGKMGIGAVDGAGQFVTSDGKLALYDNGGDQAPMPLGPIDDLVSDLDRLRQYHIVFIPCSVDLDDSNKKLLQNPQVLRNLRQYVAEGGKLYVTDWSGEFMDNVFPAEIELGPTYRGEVVDTPASAYDPATNSWDPTQFGSADGTDYDSHDGQVVDTDLHTWLDSQIAPLPDGTVAMIDADELDVVDNWNWIANLTKVLVGKDDMGNAVYDDPKPWVIGSRERMPGDPKHPLTVTFEPIGCGRILFSTYHTTPNAHLGLYPQERILLYLIMEIGVCKQGPVVIP